MTIYDHRMFRVQTSAGTALLLLDNRNTTVGANIYHIMVPKIYFCPAWRRELYVSITCIRRCKYVWNCNILRVVTLPIAPGPYNLLFSGMGERPLCLLTLLNPKMCAN